MRRHAGVQAKIKAIRDGQLQAGPTAESYHATRNAAKEMALRHGDSTSAAWILLQIATMEGRELQQQSEPQQEQSPGVTVKFVDSPLAPEEVAFLNKSAATFENQSQLPPGFMGRLRSESASQQAQSRALEPPQVRTEVRPPSMELAISEERRKELQRMCLPVGGGLRHLECRFGHGCYEAIWQQSASGEWGWSDCPACWQTVVN